MKTIADFKRTMKIGSKWHTYYVPKSKSVEGAVVDRGTRACSFSGSREFALEGCYCGWPKKSQFTASGNVVTLEFEFARLVYALLDADIQITGESK